MNCCLALVNPSLYPFSCACFISVSAILVVCPVFVAQMNRYSRTACGHWFLSFDLIWSIIDFPPMMCISCCLKRAATIALSLLLVLLPVPNAMVQSFSRCFFGVDFEL